MFAIVYKSDGFPISVQVTGVTPDPVVTWSDEGSAKGFIQSKGGETDFMAVAVDDGGGSTGSDGRLAMVSRFLR